MFKCLKGNWTQAVVTSKVSVFEARSLPIFVTFSGWFWPISQVLWFWKVLGSGERGWFLLFLKALEKLKNICNKKLWKNLPMDKFLQDPLAGDWLDINFLGQNPFSKTVLLTKWFFQDSFSYHSEMVTLSEERDGFVNVWEAEYTTAPPDWLAARQIYQALCDSQLWVYRTRCPLGPG